MITSRIRKTKSIKKKQLGGSNELYIMYIRKNDRYYPIVITKNKSLIYAIFII